MKKTRLILGLLLFAAILGSCDKDLKDKDNFGPSALNNGALTTKVASTPVSDDGIIPYIIPGANNGGNRTCAEVATAFNATFDFCGDKVDYNGSFSGQFPDGLEVTVTGGKFVAFEMDDCIKIGDHYYKVGAVIVKGSNSANVYFYPGGTLGDSGLAAPLNASGTPAGLSNLTFCFVKCEMPDLVVALKSYVTGGDWVVTGPSSSNFIDFEDFVSGASYPLYLNGQSSSPVGTLVVGNFDADPFLEVRITSNVAGMYFTTAYLFVGTEAEFDTDFASYEYIIASPPNTSVVTFLDVTY